MAEKRKLKPVLDGPMWTIGGNPDLGELQGNNRLYHNHLVRQEVVDHTIFRSADGVWNLWACIRGTKIGRLFYHWRSASLTDVNWERTGEIIRSDLHYGEVPSELSGEECIRSPYVTVDKDGRYYMFYSAHTNGSRMDDKGIQNTEDPIHEVQFCVLTSPDGISWSKYLNEEGTTELFFGPGQVRDACILRHCDKWLLYYTGHTVVDGYVQPAFYVSEATDLIHWSQGKIAHMDTSTSFGHGMYKTECPHVVERNGYFYLFRTEDYSTGKTHVFRSETPYCFGIGDASSSYVCSIDIAAPEIVFDEDGQEYISSSKDLWGGTMLGRLAWVEVD